MQNAVYSSCINCSQLCRTQKTKDLAHMNWAEVCWYFPDSREQYRLLGHLTLVGKESQDKELSEVGSQ